MGDINTTFIIGFAIFLGGSVLTILTYIYYIIRARVIVKKIKNKENYEIHYLRTKGILAIIFNTFLLFSILYISQYLGQGLSVALNPGHIILWERWVIVTLIMIPILLFFTTIMKPNSYDSSAFYVIYYGFMAFFSLFFVVISQYGSTKRLWIISSVIFFVLAMLNYLFPGSDDTRENNFGFHSKDNKDKVKAVPRNQYTFYNMWGTAFLFIAYLCYIIIISISESNGLSDALNFEQEVITYLVADLVLYGFFAIMMFGSIYSGWNKTVEIVDKRTNEVTFQSNVVL